MSYASAPDGFTKLDYARTVLGALALLMQRQNDAVGLAVIGARLEDYLHPRSSVAHLQTLLGRLDRVHGGTVTALADGLFMLSNLLARRSLVVLASDFYEDAARLGAAVQRLRHDHHEVVVFHILDPAEIEFNFDAHGTFIDLESGAALKLDSGAARRTYLDGFRAFVENTERLFRDHGADYLLLRTDQSPIPALALYLARREATA
jgi:uncharacterized protein (DUF58 family)